jgi:hypothetical protein
MSQTDTNVDIIDTSTGKSIKKDQGKLSAYKAHDNAKAYVERLESFMGEESSQPVEGEQTKKDKFDDVDIIRSLKFERSLEENKTITPE